VITPDALKSARSPAGPGQAEALQARARDAGGDAARAGQRQRDLGAYRSLDDAADGAGEQVARARRHRADGEQHRRRLDECQHRHARRQREHACALARDAGHDLRRVVERDYDLGAKRARREPRDRARELVARAAAHRQAPQLRVHARLQLHCTFALRGHRFDVRQRALLAFDRTVERDSRPASVSAFRCPGGHRRARRAALREEFSAASASQAALYDSGTAFAARDRASAAIASSSRMRSPASAPAGVARTGGRAIAGRRVRRALRWVFFRYSALYSAMRRPEPARLA
jgi:hypothetical protein